MNDWWNGPISNIEISIQKGYQNKDKRTPENIYERKNERKRLALLPNTDFSGKLWNNVFEITTWNLYEEKGVDVIKDITESENNLHLLFDLTEAIRVRCLDLIWKTPAEIYGNNTMKSKRVEKFKSIKDVKKIKFVWSTNKIMKKLQQLIEKIHPYSDMDK